MQSDYNYNRNYIKYSVRKPGVMGLQNFNSSSCFMNASIQCLVHLKGFYTSIKNLKVKHKKEGTLVYEISNFIQEMEKDSNEKNYSPKNIIKVMGEKVDQKYLEDKQRDANEFISNCIMKIHDETKTEVKKTIDTINLPNDQKEKIAYQKFFDKFYSKNDSFIINYITLTKKFFQALKIKIIY